MRLGPSLQCAAQMHVCVCTRAVLLYPNLVAAGYAHIQASGVKSDSTLKTSSHVGVNKAHKENKKNSADSVLCRQSSYGPSLCLYITLSSHHLPFLTISF